MVDMLQVQSAAPGADPGVAHHHWLRVTHTSCACRRVFSMRVHRGFSREIRWLVDYLFPSLKKRATCRPLKQARLRQPAIIACKRRARR